LRKDKVMRLFVYKTLFVFLCLIIAYKLTLGNLIKNVEVKIDEIQSRENISLIKEKIRDEIRGSVNKEQILNEQDAILLKKYFEKISSEIKNAN
tara:strand:- start:310 stop:591 length:282 start_codon:yes stop_codon:yes gene_type:complete